MPRTTTMATLLLAAAFAIACGDDDPVVVTGNYSADFAWEIVETSSGDTLDGDCVSLLLINDQTGSNFTGSFDVPDDETNPGLDCPMAPASGLLAGTVNSSGVLSISGVFAPFFGLDDEPDCTITPRDPPLDGSASGGTLRGTAEGFVQCDFGGALPETFDVTLSFEAIEE